MNRWPQTARRALRLSALLLTGALAACNAAATGGDDAAPATQLETAVPPPPAAVPPELPDLGPAPDFVNDVWLNSEPLNLASLEGKVVLVEFWTFG